MRKILRMLIIFFLAILILLTSAYFYLRLKGKDLIVQRIEQQLGRKVSFGSVLFSYPLTVKIGNLSVEGYGSAQQAIFSLNVPYLFIGEVYFFSIELLDPWMISTRGADEKISWIPALVQPPQTQAIGAAVTSAKSKKAGFALFARKVIVRNGTFQVFESLGDSAKLAFQIKNIDAEIGHVSFPVSKPLKTTLALKALVSGFDSRLTEEEFSMNGWVDFYQKDMLVQAKLIGANGQVGLSADMTSITNDMTVKGVMSFDFKAKTSGSSEKESRDVESFLLQALQSSGANVDLKFQFKTKMDDFKVEKVSLSGELNKESIAK